MPKASDIEAAIARVEAIRAWADNEAAFYQSTTNDDWKKRGEIGRRAMERLVSEHGAKFRAGVADAYRLSLAGVSSSCTSGEWGLMSNWLTAARRKLANLAGERDVQ